MSSQSRMRAMMEAARKRLHKTLEITRVHEDDNLVSYRDRRMPAPHPGDDREVVRPMFSILQDGHSDEFYNDVVDWTPSDWYVFKGEDLDDPEATVR